MLPRYAHGLFGVFEDGWGKPRAQVMENEFDKYRQANWLDLMGYQRDALANVNYAHTCYPLILHANVSWDNPAYDWLVDLGMVDGYVSTDVAIRASLIAAMMQLADANYLIDRQEYLEFQNVMESIPKGPNTKRQALAEYWKSKPASLKQFSRSMMNHIASGDLRVLGIPIIEDSNRDIDDPPYWPANLDIISSSEVWNCTIVVPLTDSFSIETISSKTSAKITGNDKLQLAFCEFDRDELDRIALSSDIRLRDVLAMALADSIDIVAKHGLDVQPCPKLWAAVEACEI